MSPITHSESVTAGHVTDCSLGFAQVKVPHAMMMIAAVAALWQLLQTAVP